MPALLFHLCAVEHLADSPQLLPQDVARALREDLEYARLGTALPDLPWYQGVRGGLHHLWPQQKAPEFARLFHQRAPVAMGLKIAELVANGALVGREPGLAFACGYFVHFVVDRALAPTVERLAARHRQPREDPVAALRRVEWAISLFYLEQRYGRPMLGDSALRTRFQFSKRRLPTAGVGRGLYELIRLGAQETLDAAPTKREVDQWVRGAFLYGLLLSSPLAARARPALTPGLRHELFSGAEVDVPALTEKALADSRRVLERLSAYISRGLFSRRARERFLGEFPEGGHDACAA